MTPGYILAKTAEQTYTLLYKEQKCEPALNDMEGDERKWTLFDASGEGPTVLVGEADSNIMAQNLFVFSNEGK